MKSLCEIEEQTKRKEIEEKERSLVFTMKSWRGKMRERHFFVFIERQRKLYLFIIFTHVFIV